VATDPLTDSAFDVYLAATLGANLPSPTAYDNHAIGPALADGSRTGSATFTSSRCGNGQFCDHSETPALLLGLRPLGAEQASSTAAPILELEPAVRTAMVPNGRQLPGRINPSGR
jgi:hypothetical protein